MQDQQPQPQPSEPPKQIVPKSKVTSLPGNRPIADNVTEDTNKLMGYLD